MNLRQRIAALPVIEQVTVRGGETRDVVGRETCGDCRQPANIIRGKVKLTTFGCACGSKLSNGNARQLQLLEACEHIPAPAAEPDQVAEVAAIEAAPVVQESQPHDPAAPHVTKPKTGGWWHWFLNLEVIP